MSREQKPRYKNQPIPLGAGQLPQVYSSAPVQAVPIQSHRGVGIAAFADFCPTILAGYVDTRVNSCGVQSILPRREGSET